MASRGVVRIATATGPDNLGSSEGAPMPSFEKKPA
jgi:hypothetical protein